MTKLTKLIKDRRVLLKITQNELATKLGFSNGQFSSNVERGICEWPPKYYKKLCNILRLDLNEMVLEAVDDYWIWLKKEVKQR
jgi:transcriptional regulator with XRE-family HTH domain